jgi:hypothetical protein
VRDRRCLFLLLFFFVCWFKKGVWVGGVWALNRDGRENYDFAFCFLAFLAHLGVLDLGPDLDFGRGDELDGTGRDGTVFISGRQTAGSEHGVYFLMDDGKDAHEHWVGFGRGGKERYFGAHIVLDKDRGRTASLEHSFRDLGVDVAGSWLFTIQVEIQSMNMFRVYVFMTWIGPKTRTDSQVASTSSW